MSGNRKYNWKQTFGRIIALLLLSVYLMFSVGIIKATHFCMGREASIALFTTEAEKCACSVYAGEKDTCCDDDHELIRLEGEQKIISTFTLSSPQFFSLDELYTKTCVASGAEPRDWIHPVDDARQPKVPRWKMHCSLVLYDDETVG